MNAKEIKKVFIDNKVSLTSDDIWKVQQTYVIKHSALERLAAACNISFENPVLLTPLPATGSVPDHIAILVRGERRFSTGESVYEWSIGEVSPSNYRTSGKQAAYPWAMCEKRAKDRVIIKLAGLHGLYSEDEADDFRDKEKKTAVDLNESEEPARAVDPVSDPAPEGTEKQKADIEADKDPTEEFSEMQREMLDQISKATDPAHVTSVMQGDWGLAILKTSKPPQQLYIKAVATKKFKGLKAKQTESA